MSKLFNHQVLEQSRASIKKIVADSAMANAQVSVLAKTLKPEEAIGEPGRRDFPILVGKERVVEACVLGAKGHAFTDAPRELVGTLTDVLEIPLNSNQNRAIFVSVINAVVGHLKMAEATVHCKDDEPETCAHEIANTLLADHGKARVGLVGLNPAIAERLAHVFGVDQVRISDRNPDNIGTNRFGVEIWDGETRVQELANFADVVLVTGTTLVNGTFDHVWNAIVGHGKRPIMFGVTGAAVSALCDLERICPCGRDGNNIE